MDNDETTGNGPKRGGLRRGGGRKAEGGAGTGEMKRRGGRAARAGAGGGVAARGVRQRVKAALGVTPGAAAEAGAGARSAARTKVRGARAARGANNDAAGRGAAGRGAARKVLARQGVAGMGGMRRRRMFDNGELRLVLLKLIADEPRHGYELIKSIEELAGGGYAPSPGVVYPTLTMLGETGHVESEDDAEGRRRFSITGAGSAELVENEAQVGKLFTRLSTTGEKHKRIEAMPVRRAMTNLKVALQDRLSRGEISDETLLQVAALIDEAAQKVERLD